MTVIALVDDESKILRFVSANLKASGFQVYNFTNGKDLLDSFDIIMPDLILLDVMMADMDGFEVLRRVRTFTDTPVILLTARSDACDKVNGLNLGADDYLTKPFSLDELFARVNAVLRRTQANSQSTITTVDQTKNLKIDYAKRRVWVQDTEIEFTNIEFKLIELLFTHKEKVITHEELLKDIWGPEYRNDIDYLRVAIAKVRRKLRQYDDSDYIVTYPGMGYMLE